MKIEEHKFGTEHKPLHGLIWCCQKHHTFLVDFETFNLYVSAVSEEGHGFLGFHSFFIQLWLKIVCVCFLEVVFLKSIYLHLWEKYGWAHSIELGEIFESYSENDFHVVSTSSLSICM